MDKWTLLYVKLKNAEKTTLNLLQVKEPQLGYFKY